MDRARNNTNARLEMTWTGLGMTGGRDKRGWLVVRGLFLCVNILSAFSSG